MTHAEAKPTDSTSVTQLAYKIQHEYTNEYTKAKNANTTTQKKETQK